MQELKRHWYIYASLMLALAIGSLVWHQVLGASEKMDFIVGFDDPSLMEGVSVTLIGKTGAVTDLGKTDGFGALSVGKDRLRKEGSVILFCREGFFCGAFLVDEERFFDYNERYIELAPIAWQ